MGSFDQDVTVNGKARGQDHITIQALPLSSSSDSEQSKVVDEEQREVMEFETSLRKNNKNNNQAPFETSEEGSLPGDRQLTQSSASGKYKQPLKCKCFFVFEMLPLKCEHCICVSL